MVDLTNFDPNGAGNPNNNVFGLPFSEEEAKLVAERTQKIITNALIIGGTMVLTYFLVKQFSGSKSETKTRTKTKKVKLIQEPEEEFETVEESKTGRMLTRIGSAVTSQITAYLLSLAKEKLVEYLQSQAQKKNAES